MKHGCNGLSISSLFCGWPWGWALKAKDGGIKNRTAWASKVMLPPYQPWATYIWLCLERKWTSFLSKLLLFQISLLATNYYSFFLLSFLNYENMITHLQETWKSQNKVTYLTAILNWYTALTTNMKLPCFLPLQVSIVILESYSEWESSSTTFKQKLKPETQTSKSSPSLLLPCLTLPKSPGSSESQIETWFSISFFFLMWSCRCYQPLPEGEEGCTEDEEFS